MRPLILFVALRPTSLTPRWLAIYGGGVVRNACDSAPARYGNVKSSLGIPLRNNHHVIGLVLLKCVVGPLNALAVFSTLRYLKC